MKKILILCTGNSCRSKMAQACLQHLDAGLYVRSAGTYPVRQTHPLAVQVMTEAGMPITDLRPHDVKDYVSEGWDYVITVCDHARETCPVFVGKVGQRIHISFPDPSLSQGPTEKRFAVFREVRDSILHSFTDFYHKHLQGAHGHEERL
jgi:arsenate reductase